MLLVPIEFCRWLLLRSRSHASHFSPGFCLGRVLFGVEKPVRFVVVEVVVVCSTGPCSFPCREEWLFHTVVVMGYRGAFQAPHSPLATSNCRCTSRLESRGCEHEGRVRAALGSAWLLWSDYYVPNATISSVELSLHQVVLADCSFCCDHFMCLIENVQKSETTNAFRSFFSQKLFF